MKSFARLGPVLFALVVAFPARPMLAQGTPSVAPGAGRSLVEQYVAIVNEGDLAALDEIVAPDFTQAATGLAALFGGGRTGPEVLRQDLSALRAAFPDLRYELERVSADDDLVTAAVTMTGTHRGPFPAGLGVVAPTGRRIEVPATETFRVVDGRIAERWVVRDQLALAQQAAMPAPDAAPPAIVPTTEIAAFPNQIENGMESVAVAADGTIYVTAVGGEIRTVAADGTWATFARFAFVGNLAAAADGALYATAADAPGAPIAVWRFEPGRDPECWGTLAGAVGPNGIALDDRGNVFVADSTLGVVWRIPTGGGEATRWAASDLLAPRPFLATFPGANGVELFGGALYVSNPDRMTIVRVPVLADGTAGEPEVWASGVGIDDFAFDVRGNLYGTTHPFNTVVRVRPDGTRETVAAAAEGVVGPTAAAFGT
ncbi:MAG: ester cyclase, partial [Chloroflexota bacterium]|nr:ester cyclase [Chloroflexota bacterium]